MKISKKILGVALALIMIFNVFAVGTFAAYPDDTAVKLSIATDKAVYSQGETVVLTFSEEVIAEIGAMRIGGQYEIAYQDAVLDLISTDYKLESHNFTALKDGAVAGSSVVQMPATSSGPSANDYGWDTTVCWCIVDDMATTFDASSKTDLFTVEMKIADDAPNGTYTIGFNPAGYEEYNAYSNDNAMGGLYGASAADYGFSVPNMYEYGTATFTVGEAAAEPKVEHVKTMGQMSNWTDENATTFNAGLVGRISDLEIEFDDEDECTTVTDIIVSITYGEGDNATTLTGKAYQLYEQEDGSYLFRAVVRGAAIADSTEFSYKYIVTLSDGSELTYESTQNTSFSEIYTTAKANYDAANPA